jgi:polyphosphate kinase
MKVNAITDDEMIRVLYSASQAGVEIELVVRAICSLRPGVRGVSDNIRVRSIVGRFLEHSRLFWFQNDGNDEMYVGSADLMERNLARRVETLAPIRNAEIRRHLLEVVLQADLQDTERAMVLDAEGNYSRPEGLAGFNAQQLMLKHYVARSD